jgi:hypothetical protein
VLQFLESDKFDAAVMDFVDEKCYVFDNDEENKFIYTDIYHEFLEHVREWRFGGNMFLTCIFQMETIISSNLQELDITTDIFYEACQTSRGSRDINKAVYEKMLALEDFSVFKKIMVKRNTELQIEAMQCYKNLTEFSELGVDGYDHSHLPDPDELEEMLDQRDDDFDPSKHTEEEVPHIFLSLKLYDLQ